MLLDDSTFVPAKLPPEEGVLFRETVLTIIQACDVERRLRNRAFAEPDKGKAFDLEREADFVRERMSAFWAEIDAMAERRAAE